MRFRIAIVTRDSERWIAIVAREYRRLGLRPLFLVDDKTTDATISVLRMLGEEALPISLPQPSVESALAQFPNFFREEWVLRMDDDEFPSCGLIKFLSRATAKTREEAIAFPRREALPFGLPLRYPTMEMLYSAPPWPFHLDPQVRAFRHREVDYTDEIHTPGFIPRSIAVAPIGAYLVHFNSIIRTLPERLKKLANYEKAQEGAGTLPAARASVPELVPESDLRMRVFETNEFDALSLSLANIENEPVTRPDDTEAEARIRTALSHSTQMNDVELKLQRLLELIETLPKPLRAFYRLSP
jgi:hypothetical protein